MKKSNSTKMNMEFAISVVFSDMGDWTLVFTDWFTDTPEGIKRRISSYYDQGFSIVRGTLYSEDDGESEFTTGSELDVLLKEIDNGDESSLVA